MPNPDHGNRMTPTRWMILYLYVVVPLLLLGIGVGVGEWTPMVGGSLGLLFMVPVVVLSWND